MVVSYKVKCSFKFSYHTNLSALSSVAIGKGFNYIYMNGYISTKLSALMKMLRVRE